MREIEVLIIGSGPAGLSTALHLLQLDPGWGERMILLEKQSLPRHKLCGGGVTCIGLETLRKVGIQLPLPIPGEEVEEARLIYRNKLILVRRKPVFVVYNRIEFDAYLCEIARQRGAVIHENESVHRLTLTEHGMEVETSRGNYLAKVVVGADGSRGISRKYLNRAGSGQRVARTLEVVVPAEMKKDKVSRHSAIFDFTMCDEALQGYTWQFPSRVNGEKMWNMGVYDARVAFNRVRANLPSMLDQTLTWPTSKHRELRIEGHPLIGFHPQQEISSPRFLAVGDAAGVDSLFGEGISPSLVYGKLAAEEISAAFDNGDYSFTRFRRRLLTSSLGRYLLIRWFLAWVTYRMVSSSALMGVLWYVGRLASALWRESGSLYPPNNEGDDIRMERVQCIRDTQKVSK